MPFIPGANIAQVNYMMTCSDEHLENVLTFQHAGAIDQAAVDALGAWLVANWDVEVSAGLANVLTLQLLRITDLTSETAPVYEYTTGLPTSGGSASPALPSNVAFCLSLRTGNRGRSGRGRIFVGGIPESAVSGNQMTGAVANALVAAYQELVDFPIAGWTWGVSSRYHNNAPRASILFQPIVNVRYVDLNVDSMRKRLTAH